MVRLLVALALLAVCLFAPKLITGAANSLGGYGAHRIGQAVEKTPPPTSSPAVKPSDSRTSGRRR